jgi:hypothetical protein
MSEPSVPIEPPVSPLEALAAELGADVTRIEREIKLTVALEIERLRAETATQMLALHDRIEAKAAALRAVPPPAEPEEPADIAPMVAKAMALIADPPAAPPQPPAVVNVTVPLPAPRTERTRVTKHDEQGRIVEIERDVA